LLTAADRLLAARITDNRRRAALLFVAVAGTGGLIVGVISLLVVKPVFALAVVVVAGAALAAAVWWGCERVARRYIRAVPADPVAHARLFNLVEGLCVAAGLPMPSLYVVDDPGLNAMTMGRVPRHASLVVTSGLLSGLNRIELEAVLAHELSHVRSYDIVTSTLAVAQFGILGAGAVAATSDGPRRFLGWLMLPLSALGGVGLQAAVGDQREAVADLSGVALTRYPPALVAALEKLQDSGTLISAGSTATAHLWLGRPAPPVAADRLAWLVRLYETHPPLDERIEALREL
jgi:heat shock protein HtpX